MLSIIIHIVFALTQTLRSAEHSVFYVNWVKVQTKDFYSQKGRNGKNYIFQIYCDNYIELKKKIFKRTRSFATISPQLPAQSPHAPTAPQLVGKFDFGSMTGMLLVFVNIINILELRLTPKTLPNQPFSSLRVVSKKYRSTIFDILATDFCNMYRRIGRKQGC